VTGFESIASGDFTGINFKSSSFKIDRHNLAVISLLNLRTYLSFIKRITSLGKLFFAISGVLYCHFLPFLQLKYLILARESNFWLQIDQADFASQIATN
jgi:hypothetical protein